MILACPACDSRYDVTGHAVGQRFRCRCGEEMTLAAPPPIAGELGCPHCGAGVAPTDHACAYCSAELLLKACPRCLSRVFAGHKHCPECGADLELAATGAPNAEHPCPRCDQPLHARRVGDIVVDECGGCLGLFLDQIAIQRVITDRQQARAEALLGSLPRQVAPQLVATGGKMYLKCPICHTVMNRKLFATGTGVIIDVCRAHGTFFDVGELPGIIEFVANGGLERAEKRELQRMRDDARRAQQDAIHAQFTATHSSSRAYAASQSTALVDLFLSFWK
ncbi:MAG TPA: zf-TFIIB domain-containing protein [Kofleriaceae bacterium]|jgi:Zn-finger nucleic acid-binding protein